MNLVAEHKFLIETRNLNFYYGIKKVLFDITFDIYEKQVTALIGPSGCGKSTYIRCLNRMNDLILNTKSMGSIIFDNKNVLQDDIDVIDLRRKIGMVFQKSNPFSKSIYENVIYGLRISGVHNKKKLDEIVEKTLIDVSLFDEVKDRLQESALSLSGGQMQRLCIARAIAVKPQVILMDEPCSALDPKSTAKVEELIFTLRKDYTIVIVTHNMQQAARISDNTAFFYEGKLVEYDNTTQIFTNPHSKETEDYITGKFG